MAKSALLQAFLLVIVLVFSNGLLASAGKPSGGSSWGGRNTTDNNPRPKPDGDKICKIVCTKYWHKKCVWWGKKCYEPSKPSRPQFPGHGHGKPEQPKPVGKPCGHKKCYGNSYCCSKYHSLCCEYGYRACGKACCHKSHECVKVTKWWKRGKSAEYKCVAPKPKKVKKIVKVVKVVKGHHHH